MDEGSDYLSIRLIRNEIFVSMLCLENKMSKASISKLQCYETKVVSPLIIIDFSGNLII